MDKSTSRDHPVQVSDDASIIGMLTNSEQRDLHCDTDGTGWQGRSISNSSIGGSKLGILSSSTGPWHMPTTKGGAVIGCGAPPPRPHALFRTRHCAVTAAGSREAADAQLALAFSRAATTGLLTDAQLALALRAVYGVHARHRHDLHTLTRRTLAQETETELGGADLSTRRRVVKATIALIKLATAKVKAARGRYAGDKPTTTDIDDGARGDFAVDVATGRGVPRDGVQPTSGARTGSVVVETSVDGRPGGDVIADGDGELDIELDVEEAVQQDSFVAPRDSGGASVAPAAAAVGLRREPPSSPAPEDASKTGRTYGDITKSPPPYLRCVLSPLSSLSPILHCTAAPLPRFLNVADALGRLWPTRYSRYLGAFIDVRTMGASVDVTHDSRSDKKVGGDFHAERSIDTSAMCGALRTALRRRRRPTDSSTLASTLAWVATDTRRPKQPAGAPEAMVQISPSRARSSWWWRHGKI